jgi:biopolymer transport protein ExbD
MMRIPPSEADMEGPNLTPVIDVVFLLLIFFLVATRFDQEEREIATRLAEVAQAQPLTMPPSEVTVNITEKGEYIVAGETLSEDALASFLHQSSLKNPGTQKVQLRADERVSFRYPARAMGMCERENIEHYCTVLETPPNAR